MDLLATHRLISRARCVVAIGGDVFSSDYDAMGSHLHPLRIARKKGVAIAFLGQSIGPFKSSTESQQWLDVAQQATMITLRESTSLAYIKNDLKLDNANIALTADVAFQLEPPPRAQLEKLLHYYGFHSDIPTVALAPSNGIARYAKLNPKKHQEAWLKLVNLLREKYRARVLLIPHVQSTLASEDDLALASEMLRNQEYDSHVIIAAADHTASEFKGLISNCQLVIAERMHAAIAGLSSGVCTVAIGYSVKASGIMQDFLGEEARWTHWPVADFNGKADFSQRIADIWCRKESLSQQIQGRIQVIRDRAETNFILLKQALTSGTIKAH
jgi:colanic acid/amylovoran biosynthesis protein